MGANPSSGNNTVVGDVISDVGQNITGVSINYFIFCVNCYSFIIVVFLCVN